MNTTTPSAPVISPINSVWEGKKTVYSPNGETMTGYWTWDNNSTYGRWFLRLIAANGQQVTGFGGLTIGEAQEYGLTVIL
jgi:hypothetical protein